MVDGRNRSQKPPPPQTENAANRNRRKPQTANAANRKRRKPQMRKPRNRRKRRQSQMRKPLTPQTATHQISTQSAQPFARSVPLHYTTQHYTLHTTLHYSTHYTTLHYILHYTTYYPTLHTTLHTTLHYTTLHHVVQNIVPDFSVFYISVNRALILLCELRFIEKPLRKGSEQSERKARAVSSAAAGAPKKSKDTPPAGEPNVARAPNFNTTCWVPGPKSPEKNHAPTPIHDVTISDFKRDTVVGGGLFLRIYYID